MPAPDPQTARPPNAVNDALDALATGVRRLHAHEDTGALAALRRPNNEHAPAFHALLAQSAPVHLFAGGSDLDTMTYRFARVVQIMAMKPDGLGSKPFGAVLHAIGFPQMRLAMLLNAQGATLDDLLRRAARRIALSDEPMPYRELGRMLLFGGRVDRRDKLDDLRLKIARDFQRATRSAAKDSD
ncbi:MAG: hypothetical protein KGL46_04700 [Hyphomicrobiales bacterium]|nr:hypothetical protein [Hyphomicrobiales bacterium]